MIWFSDLIGSRPGRGTLRNAARVPRPQRVGAHAATPGGRTEGRFATYFLGSVKHLLFCEHLFPRQCQPFSGFETDTA